MEDDVGKAGTSGSGKSGSSKDEDLAQPGTSQEGASGGAEAQMSLLDVLSLPENKDAHMVMPLTWCPHLEKINSDSDLAKFDDKTPCKDCGNVGENWICLVCREVFCSRYVNEHMVGHNSSTGHEMALSMADLSAWCYSCDYYVDNDKLYAAKNELHKSKFGEEMPKKIEPVDIQLENV